ncbi:MAG: Pyridoxal 5'-phosphate synthase (glutamine hydrolyzing), glutaminase subunit, partial [uncultured Thermomicrobiales bacterium]
AHRRTGVTGGVHRARADPGAAGRGDARGAPAQAPRRARRADYPRRREHDDRQAARHPGDDRAGARAGAGGPADLGHLRGDDPAGERCRATPDRPRAARYRRAAQRLRRATRLVRDRPPGPGPRPRPVPGRLHPRPADRAARSRRDAARHARGWHDRRRRARQHPCHLIPPRTDRRPALPRVFPSESRGCPRDRPGARGVAPAL